MIYTREQIQSLGEWIEREEAEAVDVIEDGIDRTANRTLNAPNLIVRTIPGPDPHGRRLWHSMNPAGEIAPSPASEA